MKRASKILFALVAVVVLLAGCIAAQIVSSLTARGYEMPGPGIYHGSVAANFDCADETFYTLSFRGQTASRWYWSCPTNFTYAQLRLAWSGESSGGMATVQLPSLTYESANRAGVLTPGVLTEWLLGRTNNVPADDARRVSTLFSFVEAAGRGALPEPNHHGHHFDQPVRGQVRHFLLGINVGWPVFVWVALWICLAIRAGRRIGREKELGRPASPS